MALKFSKLISDKAGVSGFGKAFHRLVKFLSTLGLKYVLITDTSLGTQYYRCVGVDPDVAVVDSDIVIADTVDGILVTEIGPDSFRDNAYIRSVSMPESITGIYAAAFFNCANLNTVTIPRTVTYISGEAFGKCPKLKTVYYNAESAVRPSSDSPSIFYSDKDSSSYDTFDIIFGKYVKAIDDRMFHPKNTSEYRVRVGTVTFEEGSCCESVGDYAFYYCTDLTRIELPNSVKSIGYQAFYQCLSLQELVIPYGVTSLPRDCLAYCRALTSLTIPHSVVETGQEWLQYCQSLPAITYTGTIAQWKSISQGYNWKYSCSKLNVVHCTDGDIAL